LVDDESITTILDEVSKGGIPVKEWPLPEQPFTELFEAIRVTPRPLVWNLTDGYEVYLGSNIPAFVQLARVPHVATGTYAQILCQNKHHLKAVAQSIGIPVAVGVCVSSRTISQSSIPKTLCGPYFVKPARLGNSIGDDLINPVCPDAEAALEAASCLINANISEVLIEELLPGKEFSIVALNGGEWHMECAHIKYEKSYFDSAAKDGGNFTLEFSTGPEAAQMITLTKRLAEAIYLRDYFRVDFRCNSRGQPRLLEVNTHPYLVSKAFNKMADIHFGSRSNMLKSMIMQSYERQMSPQSKNSIGRTLTLKSKN
jgi:D-alanine-D-alanine ligase